MMDPDDWSNRTVTIEFVGEPAIKSSDEEGMIRTYKDIRKEATPADIMQFSKAISSLTTNGDSDVIVNVNDQFMLTD